MEWDVSKLAGHFNRTLVLESLIVNCGIRIESPVKVCRVVKAVPSVLTANTVPRPNLPPLLAVPYRVLPSSDKTNPAYSMAPSAFVPTKPRLPEVAVKLCRVVKPVPSVLTANTVPIPPLPPKNAVPYRVLPDKINPAYG